MRRIKIVGLCLVAMFALSAAAASVAQALEPGEVPETAEVGACLRSKRIEHRYTGAYHDRNCKERATAEQIANDEDRYEWYPGSIALEHGAKARSFQYITKTEHLGMAMPGTITGVVGLEPFEAKVECSGRKVERTKTGAWTGTETGTATLRFDGCSLNEPVGRTCHSLNPVSPGQEEIKAGEIETLPLDVRLVSPGETLVYDFKYFEEEEWKLLELTQGPIDQKIWVEYHAAAGAGEPILDYECEPGVEFRTRGMVAAEIIGTSIINVSGKKSETSFPYVDDLYTEYSAHHEELAVDSRHHWVQHRYPDQGEREGRDKVGTDPLGRTEATQVPKGASI